MYACICIHVYLYMCKYIYKYTICTLWLTINKSGGWFDKCRIFVGALKQSSSARCCFGPVCHSVRMGVGEGRPRGRLEPSAHQQQTPRGRESGSREGGGTGTQCPAAGGERPTLYTGGRPPSETHADESQCGDLERWGHGEKFWGTEK